MSSHELRGAHFRHSREEKSSFEETYSPRRSRELIRDHFSSARGSPAFPSSPRSDPKKKPRGRMAAGLFGCGEWKRELRAHGHEGDDERVDDERLDQGQTDDHGRADGAAGRGVAGDAVAGGGDAAALADRARRG